MSKTILTVDDALTIRKMIAFTLKSAGYEVLEAADGIAALNLIKSQHVDMIISDVNMPGMDGLELTRQVRLLPAYAKTPLILLTTECDAEAKNKGRAAGATGWVVKPFKQEQLLAVTAKVLPAAAGATT